MREIRLSGSLVVIWRHDAAHLAPDNILRARLGGNGRAPVARFALIGDYRTPKFESWPPRKTGSRQLGSVVNDLHIAVT
jgi:hypothetical protein